MQQRNQVRHYLGRAIIRVGLLRHGSASLQISGDGFTNLSGERQPIHAGAFAAHDQFTCPPINVIKRQARQFGST